jgi:abortive infection alpha-like protein
VLGIKSYGDALNTVTKGLIDGAGAILGRICLPVAEEFGLLLRDRVSYWRAIQAATIAQKTERKLNARSVEGPVQAPPRLVGLAIEQGSWTDDDAVQEMWAGLIASSCTADGKDESNLIFMNVLSAITASQAKLLSYACEHSGKATSSSGLVTAYTGFYITLHELTSIAGVDDIHRLDRELDHLRALGLMERGLFAEPVILSDAQDSPYTADIAPTSLGIHMYVRCQGYVGSPAKYFGFVK